VTESVHETRTTHLEWNWRCDMNDGLYPFQNSIECSVLCQILNNHEYQVLQKRPHRGGVGNLSLLLFSSDDRTYTVSSHKCFDEDTEANVGRNTSNLELLATVKTQFEHRRFWEYLQELIHQTLLLRFEEYKNL
jgi:hypothetical protein